MMLLSCVLQLKSPKEIAKMRMSGQLVAEIFELLRDHIQPGVSLIELDQLAEEYIYKRGAEPLYKGYRGSLASHPPFPGTICASVNEVICHGIPDGRRLKEGDIISVDIGLRYHDYLRRFLCHVPCGPDQ